MRKRSLITPILAGLAILVLFSCVMLAGQLLSFEQTVPGTTISVAVPKSAGFSGPVKAHSAVQVVNLRDLTPLAADSSIHDGKVTWDSDTQVDIFLAEYSNSTGEVTVNSPYGDKLIAPGTANDYQFTIENTGDVSLDYSLTAEATAIIIKDGVSYTVPIEAKFLNLDGQYLLGDATTWQPFEALDTVADTGTLSAGYHTGYTLRWQWPFEGDDEYDTLLGDLAAAGDEMRIQVKISITVSQSENEGGQPPDTGDDSHLTLWMTLAVVSFAGFLVVLGSARKEKHEA